MKIHHLNCGTLRVPTAPLVCHVLLIETDAGLVLVDTGFGLRDIEAPAERLGPARHLVRPALDPAETALRQVEALGYTAEDVQHILITHLDFDHAGGLADFPAATVHLTSDEWEAANRPATRLERGRYRSVQWTHGPDVVTHEPSGESWRGFTATPLDDVAPGLVMISLLGHTRGHAAYAVDLGDSWVLHAGDTFYDSRVLDGGRQPAVLAIQERMVAADWKRLRANQERLGELRRAGAADLLLVNAHDRTLLERARA